VALARPAQSPDAAARCRAARHVRLGPVYRAARAAVGEGASVSVPPDGFPKGFAPAPCVLPKELGTVVLSRQAASHRFLPPPATVPLAWCYGGSTAVRRCWSHGPRPPWDQPATAKLPASQQRASHPLASPSSKRAGNTSLRPAGAVLVGPTGKPAKEWRGGDFGERPPGHVPRHPSQSRPRQGFPDSPFWLPLPIPGRCQKLRSSLLGPVRFCWLPARYSGIC